MLHFRVSLNVSEVGTNVADSCTQRDKDEWHVTLQERNQTHCAFKNDMLFFENDIPFFKNDMSVFLLALHALSKILMLRRSLKSAPEQK